MNKYLKAGTAALLAAVLGAGSAGAQTQTRVDANKDWSVFQAGGEGKKVCWIVSQPTGSTAVRDGKAVQVRRGDIFLMVSIRPADSVVNEVSFLGGYPFRQGSKVQVSVAGTSYDLFTEGENAWAPSPAEDSGLVDAFRRGATAKIKGVSTRGTTTVDTFSLSGFTKALGTAAGLCK